MDSPQVRYKLPTHASQEINGNVLVSLEIKGMQRKSKSEAKNAKIEKEFKERSLCITIDGTSGKMENEHYQLKIRKLPGEINPKQCTLKLIDDNIIDVLLVKADKETWYLKNGLETYKEEMIDKP